MIKVLYFARLREQLGTESEELQLQAGLTDVAALIQALRGRGGAWAEAFGGPTVMSAVNQEMANPATPIKDGDEVAFFPPVTGG